MNYSVIKECDVANGPGIRTSLFVSGCTHHCDGCFNKDTWDFNFGVPFTSETIEYIIKTLKPDYVTGLTLLGGEPFEPANQQALLPLVKRVREEYGDINIWCFTGYEYDRDIITKMVPKYPFTMELLSYIDVLVDGEFKKELKNLMLKFKGSSNQRTIDVQKSLAAGSVVLHEFE